MSYEPVQQQHGWNEGQQRPLQLLALGGVVSLAQQQQPHTASAASLPEIKKSGQLLLQMLQTEERDPACSFAPEHE